MHSPSLLVFSASAPWAALPDGIVDRFAVIEFVFDPYRVLPDVSSEHAAEDVIPLGDDDMPLLENETP